LKQNYNLLILSFQIVFKACLFPNYCESNSPIGYFDRLLFVIETWDGRGEKHVRILRLREACDAISRLLRMFCANWRMRSHLINAMRRYATRLKRGPQYGNRRLRDNATKLYWRICVLTYGHVPEIGIRILHTTTRLSCPFVNIVSIVNNIPPSFLCDWPLTKQVRNWATKCHMRAKS